MYYLLQNRRLYKVTDKMVPVEDVREGLQLIRDFCAWNFLFCIREPDTMRKVVARLMRALMDSGYMDPAPYSFQFHYTPFGSIDYLQSNYPLEDVVLKNEIL